MNSKQTESIDYLIIGAGIHGLSTALNLAQNTQGKSIVILDKTKPGDGATGIACGVVRNNYYQPAMRRLMAHSVDMWERYADQLHYNAVGYMQISHEGMRSDVTEIYEQQKDIGYESVFIEGEKDSTNYMKGLFDDWQAQGITSVLHEKRGGFAHNTLSVDGLVKMVEDLGVRIMRQTEVLGMTTSSSSRVITQVETTQGVFHPGEVIIAPGPWIKNFWAMLDLPMEIEIKGKDGQLHKRKMWHYWMLQEGVLEVDPAMLRTNDGKVPPVIHVDSDVPLKSDMTGEVLHPDPWGIYYKPDNHFGGVQGGFAPYPITDEEDVKVDPYGKYSKDYLVTESFIQTWCSALAFCQKRFEGLTPKYRREPSGGVGCLTPDSFPIFDRFNENVYIIADANHGYKMLGVGALVAQELLGKPSELLEPFRFNRYKQGKLHPLSNSPFPWS